ncbi:MAG: hypothetical protein M1839_004875 [Geoglossum umbratile]|nr:MAG: hypothetical protein M1839_004875 [Geoglossum umbratile]
MSTRGDLWSNNTGRRGAWTGYRSRGPSSAGRGRPSWTAHPGQPRWQQKREPPPRPPSPPLGSVLATLNRKDLTVSADLNKHSAKVTDCEYVASYNWLNRGEPVVMVPGKPAAWTPLRTPERLKEDSGEYFRDPNAARYPKHPIEPAVRAIFTRQGDFPTASIDALTCGSTMGNLLRFVRKVDKPFRFLAEVVANTVFFTRRENSPTELIPEVRGYGHTFPEAYTTWDADVKGSESHQRIIQYTFGGLKCLVRFEGDGYHRDLIPKDKQQKSHVSGKSVETREDTDHGLSEAFTFSTSSQNQQNSLTVPDKGLTIKLGGERIPQSAIFDLKTRSIKKVDQDILSDELPRLWIAQIPNFVLAYHTNGVFTDIRTRNVRGEVEDWEAENENTLRQHCVLIRKIITILKSRNDRKLEVRRVETEILELREQQEKTPVPFHLRLNHGGSADMETRQWRKREQKIVTRTPSMTRMMSNYMIPTNP